MSESFETLSVTAAARRLGVSRGAVWRMIADGELDAESVPYRGRMVTYVQVPLSLIENPQGPAPMSRTARLQEQVDQLASTVDRLSAMLIAAERERVRMREMLESGDAESDQSAPAEQPERFQQFEWVPPAVERETRQTDWVPFAVERESWHPERIPPSAEQETWQADWTPSPQDECEAWQAAPATVPQWTDDDIDLAPEPFPTGITARPNPMTHPLSCVHPAVDRPRDEVLDPVRELFLRHGRQRPWWRRLPVMQRG